MSTASSSVAVPCKKDLKRIHLPYFAPFFQKSINRTITLVIVGLPLICLKTGNRAESNSLKITRSRGVQTSFITGFSISVRQTFEITHQYSKSLFGKQLI